MNNKKYTLFSDSNKFIFIVNPFAIWQDRYFNVVCKIFYRYFWNNFNLNYRSIEDLTNSSIISDLPQRAIGHLYMTKDPNYGTAEDLLLNNPEEFGKYPKIYIAKNPYLAIINEYLVDKIWNYDEAINSLDFFNYIKLKNYGAYLNSTYTHSKENKCLVDYIIFPESIKKDLIDFYRIYRKFKEAKNFLKEFDFIKKEDNVTNKRIIDNKFITLQDIIEKFTESNENSNYKIYELLYTQEILEYLKPHFEKDFLNYKYSLNIV